FAALAPLVRQKLEELNATIAVRRSRGLDAAARIVLGGAGKRAMDEIRVVIAAMQSEEARLLSDRRAMQARQARAGTFTTIGGLALALGLVAGATILLNKAIRDRHREQALHAATEAVSAAGAASE